MQPVHSLLALLFVWLAMDAAVAGTNRPSFELSQRLKAEGFRKVGVDLLKGLSVPHNSVGAITNELKSPPVLDVLTRGLSVEPSRLAAFEALGFEDAQRGDNTISAEIWWKLPEATASEVNVIQGRLKRYVDCRWEGHTAKYALESLQASSKATPYPRSPWGSILSAHPDIPPRWLVAVTNEPITVRVPAQRLGRAKAHPQGTAWHRLEESQRSLPFRRERLAPPAQWGTRRWVTAKPHNRPRFTP